MIQEKNPQVLEHGSILEQVGQFTLHSCLQQ